MVVELVAIAIALGALVGFFLTRETIVRVQYDTRLLEGKLDRFKDKVNELESKIPPELYSQTLDPGIYLPKENDQGELEYQKAPDVSTWSDILKEMKHG